ncbi:phosphoadenylyl-sulfate reductase [Gynuella sunshinyii]|uniref:Adenosine 5'-phosphosulfate reductase n=1 Tax=Gynuella sunshinyii YC6258 TaxID=1445510 RepID=A0A0C5VZI5_9GAMM|nr:phosphoadenylyl-sulfate reductase [Gynuella sunshinyii]AJQ95829.1 3'-phosphoadenosine 5'-phosphosulfate sulfotransferase (PAPS reductase)/FAD synthetase-related enzyme [Gynuella sunshinyii YC6258]
MKTTHEHIAEQSEALKDADPREILHYALAEVDKIAISFSGAEDVVLIDLAQRAAKKLNKRLQVFTLDTGRLHFETYEFIEKVRQHYDIDLEILSPDAEKLQAFVKQKGLFSFFEDGHKECCGIRKIEPLRKKLVQLDGWITGQRRDQSPSTRSHVDVIELDEAFGTEEKPLVKFNPLANWSSKQVWEYIRMFDVPYNALHERGFISIGCQPCTRPVLPNQHEREGRWWWEEATIKECGLHIKQL